MNDATRELGAALGVAVLGSIAASQYSSRLHGGVDQLPAAARAAAHSSIAGALHAANGLTGAARAALELSAKTAFVDGIHFAVICGAILATVAAFVTYRYLPRSLVPERALHTPAEELDDLDHADERVELGLGGVTPALADELAR